MNFAETHGYPLYCESCYAVADCKLEASSDECKHRHADKPKSTNADKIRAMSDEELADLLNKANENPCGEICNNFDNCKRNNAPEPICKNHYLDWLKQEAKED